MQADVARNVSQEKRIEAGVQNGSLTNREVGKLERGQAHVDGAEARAGANGHDGHVSKGEQARVLRGENHQSGRIYHDKTNTHVRG